MPSWNPLSAQERADLVAYVKHFSARWVTEKPGTPIEIPPKPEVTAERIKAGQAVFQKSGMLEVSRADGDAGMDRPPPRSRTTRTGRFSPTTFTTATASSAAPATKTCTGSS